MQVDMKRKYLLPLLLVLALIGIYGRTVRFDFINFDDPDYVIENAMVQEGLTAGNLLRAITSLDAYNWHPLTWISLMIDTEISGTGASGYHLTNFLIHILNTLLLYTVLMRMTGSPGRSLAVAALFALHPLRVESVVWISERKDVLSIFFALLSIGAYDLYVRRKSTRHYLCAALFLALGLMAKPMLVTIPALFLLLDYWPYRRFPKFSPFGKSAALLWGLMLEKLPLFGLALASGWLTLSAQTRVTVVPFADRLSNAAVSPIRYLSRTVVPDNLSILYPHPGLPGGTPWEMWQVAGAAAVLFLITIALLLLRKRGYTIVGWFWFLGTLVPVLGFVQVGRQAMADRYTYLPHIGLFIVIVWGSVDLFSRMKLSSSPAARRVFTALFLLLLTGYAERSAVRVSDWRNSFTLYESALRASPTSPCVLYNYGLAWAECSRYDEAIRLFEEVLRIDPGHVKARNNLGLALLETGDTRKAEQCFRETLRRDETHTTAWTNLSTILTERGRIEEAIACRQKALELDPNDAYGRNNLGALFAMRGRIREAVVEFREALRLKPDFADARLNYREARALLGRRVSGAAHFAGSPGYQSGSSTEGINPLMKPQE